MSMIVLKTSMTQRGFIQLSLLGWVAVGAIAVIAGLSLWIKVEKASHASTKKEYALFVAEVKTAGDAAKKRADAENKLNQERKEKSDRAYKKLLADNQSLNKRLRDNAAGSVLPSPGPSAGSLETACFGRPELDSALRRFTEGTAELAITGQQAVDELNNAKRWANP